MSFATEEGKNFHDPFQYSLGEESFLTPDMAAGLTLSRRASKTF